MKILDYTSGMQIDPPCLILNMPDAVYHSISFGISKSGLDKIALSPAHYRFGEKTERSRAMVIGAAIHCALLQPDLYESEYMRLHGVTVRTASEYKAACKEYSLGPDYILTGPESDHIAGMQACVLADPNAKRLLTGDGYREASLFVRDPVTQVVVRVRFDFVPTDLTLPIVDLKKTRDCRPEKFMRHIHEYRYHVQAALYLDAWNWATGEHRMWCNLAVEETLPHAMKPYLMGPESLILGRKLYRENLNAFAECDRTNTWPCYDTTPELIEVPDWVLGEQEITTGETGE